MDLKKIKTEVTRGYELGFTNLAEKLISVLEKHDRKNRPISAEAVIKEIREYAEDFYNRGHSSFILKKDREKIDGIIETIKGEKPDGNEGNNRQSA